MRRAWTAGLVVGLLVLAACGGGGSVSSGDRDDQTQVIAGCKIQPNTSCVGANLAGANLRSAELNGSDLQHVYLAGADLSNADLRGANLSGATITNADLRGADLSKAKLDNVNLTGSDLTDTFFLRAATNRDIFAGTIRCRTTRPDGTIDNTSCTKPAPTTVPSTTTTTSKKPAPPTTRPTPPTSQPTPPTTIPGPPPACTLNLLQAAYVAKFGLPPDGTTFTLNACVGGYAGTNLDNPEIGPVFAVYQTQGSAWVALNVGSAGVCDGLGIPPAVAEQIGCN